MVFSVLFLIISIFIEVSLLIVIILSQSVKSGECNIKSIKDLTSTMSTPISSNDNTIHVADYAVFAIWPLLPFLPILLMLRPVGCWKLFCALGTLLHVCRDWVLMGELLINKAWYSSLWKTIPVKIVKKLPNLDLGQQLGIPWPSSSGKKTLNNIYLF